jgi:hypothetical protein
MLGTVGVGLGAVGAEGVGVASSAPLHARKPSKVNANSAPVNLLTILYPNVPTSYDPEAYI